MNYFLDRLEQFTPKQAVCIAISLGALFGLVAAVLIEAR